MKTNRLLASLAVGAGCLAISGFTAQAAVVYSNYATPSGALNPLGLEIGDQVVMGGPVTGGAGANMAALTRFQCEVYASGYTGNPQIQAQVRFYANDGTPQGTSPRPGSTLWNSGVFPIQLQTTTGGAVDGLTTYYNLNFLSSDPLSGLQNIIVPQVFTWSIQFSGLGGGDAGVVLYSPPTVGASSGIPGSTDYWVKTLIPNQWSLQGPGPGDPNMYDFGALFEGTAVPEPAPMLTMACVIGLGGFVAWRSRFKARATA
jgi:hypothetical protein